MKITVDTNPGENHLHDSLLAHFGFEKVVRERLDYGDVLFEHNGASLAIERKTVDDWAASLADNRYKEQKARFLAWRATLDLDGVPPDQHRLAYLIEGNLVRMNGSRRGTSHKAMNAAMLKTELRDGLPVLRAADPDDAAEVCIYVATAFEKDELSPRASQAALAKTIVGSGQSGVKKRKRDNLVEPKDVLRAMLCCLPGMSTEKASVIVDEYPTVKSLRKADAEDLAELRFKTRRLGPELAKRVSQHFN